MPIFDSQVGDVPWGHQPNTSAVVFGSGSGTMKEAGTLNCQVNGPGISPASTAADIVLAVYSLPASSFDSVNRGISIAAQGSFAATVNNKRVKIFVGATTAVVGSAVTGGSAIADTGTVATSGAGWSVAAELYKFGALGSNTQLGVHQPTQVGAAVSSLLAPQSLTLSENAPILIAITGNATTATTDIVFNLLTVQGLN